VLRGFVFQTPHAPSITFGPDPFRTVEEGEYPLHQSGFLCPPDGRPPLVGAELAVDVLGMRPQRVERHAEPAGDLRAAQLAGIPLSGMHTDSA